MSSVNFKKGEEIKTGLLLFFRKECGMERLTYRDKNGIADLKMTSLKDPCEYCQNAIEKLAYYEDLEEQSRLIELPCKVGESIWVVFVGCDVEEYVVASIEVGETHDKIRFTDGSCHTIWGKDYEPFKKWAFLTKEEAEAKLKEMKGNVE